MPRVRTIEGKTDLDASRMGCASSQPKVEEPQLGPDRLKEWLNGLADIKKASPAGLPGFGKRPSSGKSSRTVEEEPDLEDNAWNGLGKQVDDEQDAETVVPSQVAPEESFHFSNFDDGDFSLRNPSSVAGSAGPEDEDLDHKDGGGSEPSVGRSDLSNQKTGMSKKALRKKIREMQRKMNQNALEDEFAKMDEDTGGTISLPEFLKAMRNLGTGMDVEELTQIYYTVDINGDGDLTHAEFMSAFMAPPPAPEHVPLSWEQAAQSTKPIPASAIDWQHEIL